MKETIKVMSSREATHSQMPKYNAFQTGHGAWGKAKYDRNKLKRQIRKENGNAE